MKTFSKLALVACAALAVGLTGCAKENTEAGNGESKSVFLKITREGVAESRAAGTHVDASTDVLMNDATVYFVTATGAIMKYVTIDFTSVNAPYTNNKVGSTTIENGAEITAVPASVSRVVIIGNLPGGVYPTSGNISQFNTAAYLTVASQYTGGTVTNVALYGPGDVTATDAANNKYKSDVQIEPVCSRLEIGSISGDFAGSTIESFTLEGIYVNRYYPSMGYDGSAMGTQVNNLSVPANYNGNTAGSKYMGALNGQVCDYTAGVLVGQGTAPYNKYASRATANANTHVWAYNLLAPASGATPSLVIRVKDVVLSNGDATTYADTHFLTVRNFYLSTAPTTPLATFSKRNVYRIKELKFAESHLTTEPERNLIDVTVTAEVMTWIPNDVNYDFQ